MVSDAQKAANMRLQSKRDRIVLWLDKDGTKDKIVERARSKNMSTNAYIKQLIDNDMEESSEL